MGSPVLGMLANAGVGVGGGSAEFEALCASITDPNERVRMGCPPMQAVTPPGALAPGEPGAMTPGDPDMGVAGGTMGGLPTTPDYAGIAEALQRTPQLASAMPAPAVAGGQAYQQATPAVEALRAAGPNVLTMLAQRFGLR